MPFLDMTPRKKTLTESTAVLDTPKAVRELRPIFQGSELALGKGIVVRHVRPAMRFRDTQIGEYKSYRLGPHRGAALGMPSELTRLGGWSLAASRDQRTGPLRGL